MSLLLHMIPTLRTRRPGLRNLPWPQVEARTSERTWLVDWLVGWLVDLFQLPPNDLMSPTAVALGLFF